MAEMMKKEVNTLDEASDFVNPMMAENKWAITVAQKPDGKFLIQWMEHKMYTALDGKEYRDEVWITETGEMKLIQDLEPEHARNIIRMMLRQERETKLAMKDLYQRMEELIFEDESEDSEDNQAPPNILLH